MINPNFRWKELIESSCSWSLILYHENSSDCDERWIDFLLTTNRKFNEIKMDGLLEIGKNSTIDIFKRHGSHISKLCLFQSCLDKFDLFVEMLKSTPNLEHLIFYQTTTPCSASDVPPEDTLPEFTKLKTLEFVESDYAILKFFKRSKLNVFKLLSFVHENSSITQEPILDLLRSQHDLRTLALRCIDNATSNLFQTEILDGNVKFQLRQLSLLDIKLRQSPNDYNNLLKFLKPQAKTIKTLELGRTFPDLVYEFVFAKFKNLKSLRLMINELPKDMEFYERLEENTSIAKLVLMDSPPPNHLNNGCPPSFKEFIRHVPNVTDLTLLEYCDRGSIQFIASNLKNLKKLNVVYISESIFGGLQFPNLTVLHVQQVDSDFDWDKFTKINPGITDLVIQTCSLGGFNDWAGTTGSIDSVIELATRNLRLQTLKIGNNFLVDENFYDIIRENCPDLKVLYLHKACALEAPIMDGIPGLRFHDGVLASYFNKLEFWNDADYDEGLPEIDRGSGNWDANFLDPLDMHFMDIDDYDEYDQQDDFYDDYDDFVDEFDENSDFEG